MTGSVEYFKFATSVVTMTLGFVWFVLVNMVTKPLTSFLILVLIAQIETVVYYVVMTFHFVRWLNIQRITGNLSYALTHERLKEVAYFFDAYYSRLYASHIEILGVWLPSGVSPLVCYIVLRNGLILLSFLLVCYIIRWEMRRIRNSWTEKYGHIYEGPLEGFEKVFPHSQLCNVDMPTHQACIFRIIDGVLLYAGVCFREGDWLFTANHVVEGVGKMLIRAVDGTKVEVDSDDWEHLTLDVAVMSYSSVAKKLVMKSAKGATCVDLPQAVRVAARGQASYGVVRNHEVMGMVTYDGSTVAGFSGAPYMMNNTVLGIHTGYEKTTNVGVSFAYVYLILKLRTRGTSYVQEDTDEYFDYEMARATKQSFAYQRDPCNPDEYLVRVNGKYHMIQSDSFYRLSNKYLGEEVRDFVNYDSESAIKKTSVAATQTERFLTEVGVQTEAGPTKLVAEAGCQTEGIPASNANSVSLRFKPHKTVRKEEPLKKQPESFLEKGRKFDRAPPIPPRNLKVKAAEVDPIPRSSMTYESAIVLPETNGESIVQRKRRQDVPNRNMIKSRGTEYESLSQTSSSDTDDPELTPARSNNPFLITPESTTRPSKGSKRLLQRKKQKNKLVAKLTDLTNQLDSYRRALENLNIPCPRGTSDRTLDGYIPSGRGGET